jgi:penicillin-binding protein 1A
MAVTTAFAGVALLSLALPYAVLHGIRTGLPDRAAVAAIGHMDQATAVYDAQGQLAFTIFKEQRLDTPLSGVSPHLVDALLAIEDRRFYDHHGVDSRRVLGAAWSNVRHGRIVQGGSTITQQLARQSFLTSERTVRRKLQELVLASRIEAVYSKPQILELYLNKVYFGDGLYGAEAASRGYFDKHASELSVAEAAVLAGVVKAPSAYAPTVSLPRATARRNVVLHAMLTAGVIDQRTWQAARASKIVLHDGLPADEPHGQYFKKQVRQELVDRFGWPRVYQGGLRVYATIDMSMQVAAEVAVADSLAALDRRRQAAGRRAGTVSAENAQPLQAALVALDPKTGEVRAMVGGRDYHKSPFNRAVQAKRQPGSAFKPFVYAAALEAGYTPASVIEHLDEPIATLQGAWTPEDEHATGDAISLRAGLRTSSNRAAVRLLQEIGIPRAVAYAKGMGVGDVPAVPSLALGSGEVTLQSMTAAYAAFANRGMVPRPRLIRRVEDRDGRVLFEATDQPVRAVSEDTAFLMSSMLADVIDAGTAARARTLGFTLPAAGKTGTTNGFNDAWFVGFTPTLVSGVWVGFDEPHTILANGFAADVAVPLWTAFMKSATSHDRPAWLPVPAGVTTASVCRVTGKRATEGCGSVEVVDADGHVERRSMIYTEYFARGTEPTAYCDRHPTHGFFGSLAAMLSGREGVPPLRLADAGIGPSAAPLVEPAAHAAPDAGSDAARQSTPAEKKRGFFARIFGRR